MGSYRYSQWDGSQDLPGPGADELMDELGRRMMSGGDLSQALRMMQRTGMKDGHGPQMTGLQDLLQRLQQQRQGQLDRYDMGSIMGDIRRKLDDILKAERQGIQRRLDEARRQAGEGTPGTDQAEREGLRKVVEDMAARNLKKLGELPSDVSGRVKELSDYDFMDGEARRQFEELLDTLKQNAMRAYARDLAQQIRGMDAGALAGIRNFAEAVNQMLEQRLKGEEPDFDAFMQQFGNMFGPEPPKDLDELIDRLRAQMAQAQALLDSLSPEDRKALEDLLRSMLDNASQRELARLAAYLEALRPGERQRRPYPFSGEESISYNEALRLMEELQKMDRLEEQLRDAQYNRSIEEVDEQLLKQVMGDRAAGELEALRQITKALEDAGYIRRKNGQYELTPRGMRKIGQRALADIFAQLRKDRTGAHNINRKGRGGEHIEETRPYEFGDDFQVDLERTIMNALRREASRPPVRLAVGDFEVYRTEELTRSATVLMLDLSLSMPMRGNFQAAKRVAVALDGLIRSQYPRDTLAIVGFSSYARRIKKEDLSCMSWDEFDPYTNIQHGLFVARKLLSKETCANRQIILISDGEPTAHIEGGNFFFQYPPSLRTLQLTLREVRNCTQKGIIINTFMLESGRHFHAFVTQMARVNKGRVFYTTADKLGEYLLMDYVSNRKRRL